MMVGGDPSSSRLVSMKYLIIMSAVDRRESGRKNRIAETLASLEESGLSRADIPFEFHIFDSGSNDTSYIPPSNAKVHDSHKRLTANENILRMLEYAGGQDCEYVVFIEDDVAVSKGWLQIIDRYVAEGYLDGFPMMSFYCFSNATRIWRLLGRPAFPYPVKYFAGTQCFALKREDAISLAAYLKDVIKKTQATHHIDWIMRDWMMDCHPGVAYFWGSMPSLVQHIGVGSTLDSPPHKAKYFGQPVFGKPTKVTIPPSLIWDADSILGKPGMLVRKMAWGGGNPESKHKSAK